MKPSPITYLKFKAPIFLRVYKYYFSEHTPQAVVDVPLARMKKMLVVRINWFPIISVFIFARRNRIQSTGSVFKHSYSTCVVFNKLNKAFRHVNIIKLIVQKYV